MPHVFDTALAAPQRTLILNGIVTLLAGLLRPTGYLQAVIPWAGVVRSWTDIDGITLLAESLQGRAPAIAVAVGDRTSSPAGGGFHHKGEIEVLLYFVSNHMRDVTAGRQTIDVVGTASTTADPGLHVIMEHAEELVIGQRCGASNTIKQCRPDREEELVTRDDLTIWLQTYKVTVARSIDEWRTVTQLLESIRWRTTQEDGETELPLAAIKETTIDVYSDDLDPP